MIWNYSDPYDEFFVGFIPVLSNLSTYLQRLDVKSIYVTRAIVFQEENP